MGAARDCSKDVTASHGGVSDIYCGSEIGAFRIHAYNTAQRIRGN